MARQTALYRMLEEDADRKLTKEDQAERAAELEEALVLYGSAKPVEWATRIKYVLLRDAYVSLVEEGTLDEDHFETEMLTQARIVTAARWWIDNRENGDSIEEILGDSGEPDLGDRTENPH